MYVPLLFCCAADAATDQLDDISAAVKRNGSAHTSPHCEQTNKNVYVLVTPCWLAPCAKKISFHTHLYFSQREQQLRLLLESEACQ